MKTKLVRSKVLHDCHAEKSDRLNGNWHKGYRLPNSETVAFYSGGWFASVPGKPAVVGPFESKETALNQ